MLMLDWRTSEKVMVLNLAARICRFFVGCLRNSGLLRAISAFNRQIPIASLFGSDRRGTSAEPRHQGPFGITINRLNREAKILSAYQFMAARLALHARGNMTTVCDPA